jgi:hypothetical protein
VIEIQVKLLGTIFLKMEEQRVCVNALKNEENLAVVMQEATRADE